MILTNMVVPHVGCFLLVCEINYHLHLSLELAISSELHSLSAFRVIFLQSTVQTSLVFTKKPSNLFVVPKTPVIHQFPAHRKKYEHLTLNLGSRTLSWINLFFSTHQCSRFISTFLLHSMPALIPLLLCRYD